MVLIVLLPVLVRLIQELVNTQLVLLKAGAGANQLASGIGQYTAGVAQKLGPVLVNWLAESVNIQPVLANWVTELPNLTLIVEP